MFCKKGAPKKSLGSLSFLKETLAQAFFCECFLLASYILKSMFFKYQNVFHIFQAIFSKKLKFQVYLLKQNIASQLLAPNFLRSIYSFVEVFTGTSY